MSLTDFIRDLTNPDLAFLWKALLIAVMSSIICGVVGCYVVLRGMAFIGDAVAHAVFPGLAVAFVIGGNLILGGIAAGVLTAVLVAVFSQNRRLKEDSVIGVFFVAAFALGIVIISRAPGYAGSLQDFLFGSITGIPDEDLYIVAGTGLAVLAALFALHKELVTISLDRETARAMGIRVFCARPRALRDRHARGRHQRADDRQHPGAGAADHPGGDGPPAHGPAGHDDGALAGDRRRSRRFVGLYVSWSWDYPTGGTIVLVLTAFFLLAWCFAPRQGAIARRRLRTIALRAAG